MTTADLLLRITFAVVFCWALAIVWFAPESPWGVVAAFISFVAAGLIVWRGVEFR